MVKLKYKNEKKNNQATIKGLFIKNNWKKDKILKQNIVIKKDKKVHAWESYIHKYGHLS